MGCFAIWPVLGRKRAYIATQKSLNCNAKKALSKCHLAFVAKQVNKGAKTYNYSFQHRDILSVDGQQRQTLSFDGDFYFKFEIFFHFATFLCKKVAFLNIFYNFADIKTTTCRGPLSGVPMKGCGNTNLQS